ncbi:TIGR00341 family protein [Rhodohalobacter sp. 614A]|uniref:TIGR00341 family protein n=1 Tax=Rhodohalobacter sp. 614A TaxID=2908649 RepID=UPI001F171333|nr:TIGR00341 family protein [Rhodohalobacter sp. 614A]
MPLRQIEVVIPKEGKEDFEHLLNDDSVEHYWNEHSESSGYLLKALVDANQTESFLDKAEHLMGEKKGYRLIMQEVEATLPRVKSQEEDEPSDQEGKEEPWEAPLQGIRVSREELYNDITDGVNLSGVYLAMVSFSTIVAALGMLRDSAAIVIGAMVIAPLLGPNVALALSTTLGDSSLFRKALKTNISGIGIALLISIVLGFILSVDASAYQLESRTQVHLSDIALALASGAAGVLAYTIGMSAAVIGVMVAVALLPPLVTAGLLIGDLQWGLAYYAILLLTTNIICVNLAAVATFTIQGIKPRTWYKAEKAKRVNKIAFSIWIVLLVILALLIFAT